MGIRITALIVMLNFFRLIFFKSLALCLYVVKFY